MSRLSEYVAAAEEAAADSSTAIERWSDRVKQFLSVAIGPDAADDFASLGRGRDNSYDELPLKRGYLEGLIAKAEGVPASPVSEYSLAEAQSAARFAPATRRIFIVHGHDGETKEAVARFLEKLGLEPVILHEQANQGRTIIEKFEVSSGDVAFAVVLLTPDDRGCATNVETLQPRARQNVILELGYFMGRLGRTRVCALHKGGVELPSDYQGVVYIELDSGGAWKAKLAQEFVQAKLTINLEALINR